MAGYRKRNGKWEVRIRRQNSKNLSKTFINRKRWRKSIVRKGRDLIQTLSRYEEWKKNNQGKSYDDFLKEMGLLRKKYNSGGDVEEYSDLIDAYEKGIDVMEDETLTQYIKRIKASEKQQ